MTALEADHNAKKGSDTKYFISGSGIGISFLNTFDRYCLILLHGPARISSER
jgi:hypothetical protein